MFHRWAASPTPPALVLDDANGIAIFESGGVAYAAVASYGDDGVQIRQSGRSGQPCCGGRHRRHRRASSSPAAGGIAVFESGGTTYAAVAADNDDGVQILSLADPANPAAAGSHHR